MWERWSKILLRHMYILVQMTWSYQFALPVRFSHQQHLYLYIAVPTAVIWIQVNSVSICNNPVIDNHRACGPIYTLV